MICNYIVINIHKMLHFVSAMIWAGMATPPGYTAT